MSWQRVYGLVAALVLGSIVPPSLSAQTTPRIATENYFVPATDPGIQLSVRNKRPEAVASFAADRILLMVHGATYPGEPAFDLPLGGVSWMDYAAQRGFDVYLMNVRGYGMSTRPPQMSQPASENKPIVHTEVAVKDVGAVVDHILARRGVTKINLLGWSWGTVLTGAFTAGNNAKVERLVLYAPSFLQTTPSPTALEGPLGAYRSVTKEAAAKRRRAGLTDAQAAALMPQEWFDAWWAANLALDPVGAAQNPPVVRAPEGGLEDGRRYCDTGEAYC